MSMVLYNILRIVLWVANAYVFLIMLSAILSWFINHQNRYYQLLRAVTEPVVYPFRKLTQRFMPQGMMFDISPMLAYLALQIVISILQRVLVWLYYY